MAARQHEPDRSASLAATAAQALHDSARVAIPLGITLVTGVFVALGIEGDTLGRLLRTSPLGVALALLMAIAGVTLPFLLSGLRPAWLVRVEAVAAALLLAATGTAVVVGVIGVGSREQPAVDLTTLSANEEAVTVRVDAAALSLAPDDRMLLRIATFTAGTSIDDAQTSCSYTVRGGARVYLPGPDGQDPPTTVAGAEVIHWGETGPTAKGEAATSFTFVVRRDEHRFVCALAALKDWAEDGRASMTLVDVRSLGVEEASPD